MGRRNRWATMLTAAVVAALNLAVSARQSNRPSVWANNFDAVFSIETTGHLYNGTTEQEFGTGFFIDEKGLALTAIHVVFANKENYKEVTVAVSLPGRAGSSAAEIVHVDAANDIALLRVSGMQHGRRVTVGNPSTTPIGTDIDVIGYPLGLGESIVPGAISAKPRANAWQMSAPVNPGTSGAPVFDDELGTAIGLVTAGVTKITRPDGSSYWVEGIKYFVPLDIYSPPGIFADLGRRPITDSDVLTTHEPPRAEPLVFTRGYHVSLEKADHPVLLAPHHHEFTEQLQAEPGYRITGVAGVSEISANHASPPRFSVSPDGHVLTVSVVLTSGPWVDRYRAWYDATILTRQEKESSR
jgi:V8-like Glu-specific endopeptidase